MSDQEQEPRRARHDESNGVPCVVCFAHPGEYHQPTCMVGLLALTYAERDQLRDDLRLVRADREHWKERAELAERALKRDMADHLRLERELREQLEAAQTARDEQHRVAESWVTAAHDHEAHAARLAEQLEAAQADAQMWSQAHTASLERAIAVERRLADARTALEGLNEKLAQVMKPGWSHSDLELEAYAVVQAVLASLAGGRATDQLVMLIVQAALDFDAERGMDTEQALLDVVTRYRKNLPAPVKIRPDEERDARNIVESIRDHIDG